MRKISLLMVIATALLFASCEKDNESITPLITSIQEDDLATSYNDEVENEADELSVDQPTRTMDASAMFVATDNGRTVVRVVNNDGSITKTVTYTSWTNPNGNQNIVKNGKIVITIVGTPSADIYTCTITFENFTINGAKIEGTRVITKTAQYQFNATCDNGKITFADGKTYTRSYTRTRTWVDGTATPLNVWDDVFEITGTATGINRNGNAYTHTIVNPLRIERTCKYIVSGTITVVVNDKTLSLDYGAGTCDNLATITYNGKTTEIKLRGGK